MWCSGIVLEICEHHFEPDGWDSLPSLVGFGQVLAYLVEHRNIDLGDLLEMPAVRQLEKDPKYTTVFRLLDVFLSCRLDAYLDFQAKSADVFKSFGPVHEDCVTKMRLMPLAGLASKGSGDHSITRDSLKVSEDDAEY